MRGRLRARSPRAGILAAAFLLLGAASAAATPAWAPPREISDSASAPLALAASTGLGRTGNAVVLWHSADGVQAVTRPARRSFGAPHPIPGSKLSMPDLRPGLAFDARGATLAIWSYFEPHPRFVEDGYAVDYTFGLRVAGRTPNGMFGRAQTLADKLDADPSADVVIDPGGTAVVIWTDEAGTHAAARPAGDRRFGSAQVIGETQAEPQIAVAGSGSATVAWASLRGIWTVAATASDGYRFGRAARLAIPGLGRAKPVIGVDGRSAVTAAWTNDGRVMAATCRASGRCGSAQALSPAGEAASDPRVAVTGDGTAIVAWRSRARVAASLRRGHGRFRSAATLAALGDGEQAKALAVAVGPRGDAAALWLTHAPNGDRVAAALRHGATPRFANASALTGPVPGASWSDPEIAVDANGDALAAWGAMIDGHPSIQASSYDAG